MALLTKDGLDRVIKLLVDDGLVDAADVARVQQEVLQTKRPIIETLLAQKLITNEMLAHQTRARRPFFDQ